MFGNLIESGSHVSDLKRKSRFFIGTALFYGLLMLATGVGSIYAYNARLDERGDEYELLALMRFPPADQSEPRREQSRPAATQSHANQLTTRPEVSMQTPYHGDRIADASTKEVRAGVPVSIAPFTSDPVDIGGPIGPVGPGGHGNTSGTKDDGPTVADSAGDVAPPVAVRRPTPAPISEKPTGPIRLPSEVIASKTISKPAPPYPAIAKLAHVQGSVSVQILIDEQGRVVSAKAASGHPLLQAAAVQAAYRASFTPTLLSKQPVKVTGVIIYNFVLQ